MSSLIRAHDPVRIVHLPTGTGGHPLDLSRAERSLGFQSDVVDFAPGSLAYAADRVFDIAPLSAPDRATVRLRFLADAAHPSRDRVKYVGRLEERAALEKAMRLARNEQRSCAMVEPGSRNWQHAE